MNQVKQNPWLLILGIIVLATLIFTVIQKKDGVAVYRNSNIIEGEGEDVQERTDTLEFDTIIFTAEGYSLSVPSDWEKVTKSGHTTFVHAPSASSFMIQCLDYDPNINNMNETLASIEVSEKGNSFVSFLVDTNNHYQVIYQDIGNSVFDYVEDVRWNREKIYKLICTVNDEYYEKMIPYFEKMLDTFSWQATSPDMEYPANSKIYYNSDYLYEIALPIDFSASVADSTLVGTLGEDASITVTAFPFTDYLDNANGTDITNIIGSGKNGFILRDYSTSHERVNATYSYLLDNVQVDGVGEIYASGQGLYLVCVDYKNSSLANGIAESIINTFRAF